MRPIFVIALVAISTGCVTREQIAQRNADMDIANFGPRCERLGLKPQTPDWAMCVSNYAKGQR